MKHQQPSHNSEDPRNHKGRAYLKAVQSDGLSQLQANLDKDDSEIPPGVDEHVARQNRASLHERINQQIVRAINALKTMARTSAPHIRRFYQEVLQKRVFTRQNLERLVSLGKRSWDLLTTVYHWIEEQCQSRPGRVGVIGGAIAGFWASSIVAGPLALIPFIGQTLASIATLIGIASGAYLGFKLAMELHEPYYRDTQLSQQAQIVEKLEAILAHPGFVSVLSE